MTITTKTKREYEQKIKELRAKGYNIVTLGKKFTEMEKADKMVIVSR